MRDVVVDDSYVEKMGRFLLTGGERFEECLKNYVALMQVALTDGIQSGQTKEAFAKYIEIARELQGGVGEITEMGAILTGKYILEADIADRYLY